MDYYTHFQTFTVYSYKTYKSCIYTVSFVSFTSEIYALVVIVITLTYVENSRRQCYNFALSYYMYLKYLRGKNYLLYLLISQVFAISVVVSIFVKISVFSFIFSLEHDELTLAFLVE